MGNDNHPNLPISQQKMELWAKKNHQNSPYFNYLLYFCIDNFIKDGQTNSKKERNRDT